MTPQNPSSPTPVSRNKRPVIVVLAAGSVNERLRHLGLRAQTPALLPVHTRPLAAYVLEFYLARPIESLVLAVDSEHAATVEADLIQYRGRFRVLPVPRTRGVVDTLRFVLETLSGDDVVCVVNVVTTIPTEFVEAGQVLVANKSPDHLEVSALESRPEGVAFYSKGECCPPNARSFSGVFALPLRELKDAAASATRVDDLVSVLQASRTKWQPREIEWIDCGHEVNFYDARARLVTSRSFNRLVIDRDNGVVRKRSQNRAKLQDEAGFIQALPSGTAIFFPRLVSSYREQGEMGEYAVEYYGYPNVAEYLLYWDLSPAMWRRMFAQFGVVLRTFAAHRRAMPVTAFEDFYVHRAHERINEFLRSVAPDSPAAALAAGDCRVNGAPVRPLADLLDEVGRIVVPRGTTEVDTGIMHGDFCFNNILYDLASGVVRLIDPRGRFGPMTGIHGDARYDLAKLMHSAAGHYDLIVNGLYELHVDRGDVRLAVASRAASIAAEDAMGELLTELKADKREIRVLMGLLFITMPPLHTESSTRQLAFFAHGLRVLTDSFS